MSHTDTLEGMTQGPLAAAGECTVCGDVGVPGTVLSLDPGNAMATLQIRGEIRSVAIDLLEDLKVGDRILVHAGVAIARVEECEV